MNERGLSSQEVQHRRSAQGRNEIAAPGRSVLAEWLRKFWSPIPWLLQLVIVLAIIVHRAADALAVFVLLIFNATLAFLQERRAGRALELLRSKIVVHAKVLRDGIWTTIAAGDLVCGDVVHLQSGDAVPADVQIDAGAVQVDQSALTGESLPRDARTGETVYAASSVKRGEATATVTATGPRTKFGKTADLIREVRVIGSLERLVFRIVRSLFVVSIAVVALVAAGSLRLHVPAIEIVSYAIVVLLASIPVALPAAFTLAGAIGSLNLAAHGVLTTRLGAIEDAATMSLLCTDKTGTLTRNEIRVCELEAVPPYTQADLLQYAAAASDASGQDPLDLAILSRLQTDGYGNARQMQVQRFTPFDPETKRAAASVRLDDGTAMEVLKGAPTALGVNLPAAEQLAAAGSRVIGVAVKSSNGVVPVGVIGLADAPRYDAAVLVREIQARGVNIRMLTGDTRPTALRVAQEVGIPQSEVVAGIFPEQKLQTIREAQAAGHVVGMTGDGVNDAPALEAANVGIAVSNATDVAKSAAGVILTEPGLQNVLSAIDVSRQIYQRMLTYVIVRIVKYFEIVFVTGIGFFIFRHFLLTPELMVALLVLNDFLTLAIATDRVSPSRGLDAWHVGRLIAASATIAASTTAAILFLLLLERSRWHLNIDQLRGVAFVAIASMGQFAVLALRERDAIVRVRPSPALIAAAAGAVTVEIAMALQGVLMPRIPGGVVAEVLAAVIVWASLLLLLKIPVFRAFGLKRQAGSVGTP